MTDFRQTPYWLLFADTVKFFREHLPPSAEEDYWTEACAAAAALAAVWQGTAQERLCNDLLKAMLEELARRTVSADNACPAGQ